MNLKKLGLAVIAAQLVAYAAWAHHSHGAYAMTDYTEIDGVVTEVYWINPHAWVYLDVENEAGEIENWALEAAGATTLIRAGLSEDTVQFGDRIHVRCHPLRDGSNGCLLGYVTTEDGTEVLWD
ncbi:MAG: DUF6152 family protein [Gammaproteobacteria bacterium]